MPTEMKKDFSLGDKIHVLSSHFPFDKKVKVYPGDLTQFAPYGSGVYGYQMPDRSNPFTGAPEQEEMGGVVYLDNSIYKRDFSAFMRLIGVSPKRGRPTQKDYSVFVAESNNPIKDGYLAQMRIVSKFAMSCCFKAITDAEYDNFPKQTLTQRDALWEFIKHENMRWGTSFHSKSLEGLFGGDGDFAREELSFGFMVENSYFGIYRIWSRAWLVTK